MSRVGRSESRLTQWPIGGRMERHQRRLWLGKSEANTQHEGQGRPSFQGAK
jgi:hypothetical protein